MLKINLSDFKLNKFVNQHCDSLTPKVKTRLNRAVNSFLLAYFTDDIKIRKVLSVKPAKMTALEIAVMGAFPTKPANEVIEALKRVFNPSTFFDKTTAVYNAFDLCNNIGLITCPYCNINFVNTIQRVKRRELILRPPLDHFLSKGDHPLFGLSFFNLIPSCWICNSSFKHMLPTNPSTHLNPYFKGFGNECVFTFSGYKKIQDIISKKGAGFNIVLNNISGDARFAGNNDLFKLEIIYNEFKPVAKRTLVAAMNYPKEQIESIINISRSSKIDAYEMIFNTNYEETELHKSPFSKIKRDLVIEFGSMDLKSLLSL
ncbi:hypothetical protein PQ469_24355 [Mucilaginibacter sp. KACC 22773]|uniref:hypothetical protein n=1 Tax=Mucilaginibacter sp. KACC 22773 TaxID=3025671 RepID=UPI002366855B|nr:hypothetical protein [Mucilaginibacter sp. KACC 22773]WDF77020.1 hypothetical protein PQ469_24355 [Mucilaginibacter sp. KACC 22773]